MNVKPLNKMNSEESLFKIDQEIELLECQLYDSDGQITDDTQAIIDNLKGKEAEKENFLLSVAHSVMLRKKRLAAVKSHREDVDKTEANLKKEIEFYSQVIKQYMPENSRPLFDGTVTVKETWRKRLYVDPCAILPDAYVRPKYKDNPLVKNSDAIEKALKDGAVIHGCRLDRVRSISIK